MRLRRGVVLALIQRNGVVPATVRRPDAGTGRRGDRGGSGSGYGGLAGGGYGSLTWSRRGGPAGDRYGGPARGLDRHLPGNLDRDLTTRRRYGGLDRHLPGDRNLNRDLIANRCWYLPGSRYRHLPGG